MLRACLTGRYPVKHNHRAHDQASAGFRGDHSGTAVAGSFAVFAVTAAQGGRD
jgi:hypothetical protein